eukprot:gene6842-1222_t
MRSVKCEPAINPAAEASARPLPPPGNVGDVTMRLSVQRRWLSALGTQSDQTSALVDLAGLPQEHSLGTGPSAMLLETVSSCALPLMGPLLETISAAVASTAAATLAQSASDGAVQPDLLPSPRFTCTTAVRHVKDLNYILSGLQDTGGNLYSHIIRGTAPQPPPWPMLDLRLTRVASSAPSSNPLIKAVAPFEFQAQRSLTSPAPEPSSGLWQCLLAGAHVMAAGPGPVLRAIPHEPGVQPQRACLAPGPAPIGQSPCGGAGSQPACTVPSGAQTPSPALCL